LLILTDDSVNKIKEKMSSYVLMKILESTTNRYDKGIRMLTLGTIDKAYDRLTASIHEGQVVLDIGCGTGALTIRAAQKGAKVRAIDINPQMMEIAQQKIQQAGLSDYVEFCEIGVAELDAEKSESFDVVMSGLCFSELSENELNFGLYQINRILKPGGILLVGDEVCPRGYIKKIIYRLVRFPLVIITYLITQTTTHAFPHLTEKIKGANFEIEHSRENWLGSFLELVAKKRAGERE
jgi:ubiquinone/menaquinone biosynthesis C-methylase UbiE